MPMHLRSGVLKEGPRRQYTSAYQIFHHERIADHRKKGLSHQEAASAISEEWHALDEQAREKFEDQFMELEKKFQDQLIIHYGGSGKDVKKLRQLMEIPEKPKKPASGCLHYIAERRKDAQAQHPDMSATQITKFLADEYGNLSIKERKKYEEAFERGMNEYHMAIEAWRKKYQQKQEEFDQFVDEKFKKSAQKEELDYQELEPYRRGPREASKMNKESTERMEPKNVSKQGKGDKMADKEMKEMKETKEGDKQSKKMKDMKEAKEEEMKEKKDPRKKSQGRR